MNVLLVIDGREAIPVRAIPFLTNGDVLSPAVVAEVLAGDSEYFRLFNGLTAHRVELGATKPIPTAFWKNTVVSDIDALSDRIKDRQVTHADGPNHWRAGSLECLPAGAFVWRDEFEPRFWATHGPDAETVGRFSSTNEDEWITRNKESEVDFDEESELDFDPFISPDYIARLVMEGFDVTEPVREAVLVIDDQSATKAEPPGAEAACSVIHSTKTRRNTLTPVIELAQKQCRNPKDAAEVWSALLVLAEKKHPPLLGATEDGLQYLKGGVAAIFKRESLRKRLGR